MTVSREGLGKLAVVAGDLDEGPGGAAYDLIAARLPVPPAAFLTFPSDRPLATLDALFAGRELRVDLEPPPTGP